MSLERHGDFAPIMLTNKPGRNPAGKLLPKDGQILKSTATKYKSDFHQKTSFIENKNNKRRKFY